MTVNKRVNNLRMQAFFLTFIAYTAFHMSRKPPSIVKSVLHPQNSDGSSSYDPSTNRGWTPYSNDVSFEQIAKYGYKLSGVDVHDDDNGNELKYIQGDYDCSDLGDDKVCKVFSHDGGHDDNDLVSDTYERLHYSMRLSSSDTDNSEYKLCSSLRKEKHQKETKNDNTNLCWLLLSTSYDKARNSQVDKIHFIQGHGGKVPAIVVSGSDKLAHYWYKVKRDSNNGDIEFSAKKDIAAIPRVTNGKILLGILDTVFLSFYTVGLFISGWAADQITDLRVFLSIGLWGSGISLCLLGFAYWFHVHSFFYFCLISSISGLFQSIGWPCVVSVMSHWYGKKRRGFIFGVWNSHQSLGNAIGSVITAASISLGMHREDWPLGYLIPGFITIFVGLLTFTFLVAHPRLAGTTEEETQAIMNVIEQQQQEQQPSNVVPENGSNHNGNSNGNGTDYYVLVENEHEQHREESSNGKFKVFSHFFRALLIPGVIPFSLSLAFVKLVGYAIIFWAPSYITHLGASPENAGYLSTFFDFGGVFGGIAAGWLSDKLNARAIVAFVFLLMSTVSLYCYYHGSTSLAENGDITAKSESARHALLMIFAGFTINGPYSLIITAVSADLGTHPSLKGDSSLLATVTGIIDGSGSLGAVVQGVLIGNLSTKSWEDVFNILIACCLISATCLSHLVYKEIQVLRHGHANDNN